MILFQMLSLTKIRTLTRESILLLHTQEEVRAPSGSGWLRVMVHPAPIHLRFLRPGLDCIKSGFRILSKPLYVSMSSQVQFDLFVSAM